MQAVQFRIALSIAVLGLLTTLALCLIIVQNLAFRVPPVALVVEPVLGAVVVRSLARKSLSSLKELAEKKPE